LFLSSRACLFKNGLGLARGIGLQLRHRLFLRLQLRLDLQQASMHFLVALTGGQLQGSFNVQIQPSGNLFGNRFTLFDKSDDFLRANLRQFHQAFQLDFGIGRQPQADIFADGLNGIKRLGRKIVLCGKDAANADEQEKEHCQRGDQDLHGG
jgi:hypothetical protein